MEGNYEGVPYAIKIYDIFWSVMNLSCILFSPAHKLLVIPSKAVARPNRPPVVKDVKSISKIETAILVKLFYMSNPLTALLEYLNLEIFLKSDSAESGPAGLLATVLP